MLPSDENEPPTNTPLFVVCMLDDFFRIIQHAQPLGPHPIDPNDPEPPEFVITYGPRDHHVYWENMWLNGYIARYFLDATLIAVDFHLPDPAYTARPPIHVHVHDPTDIDRHLAVSTLQDWRHFLLTELRPMIHEALVTLQPVFLRAASDASTVTPDA
jgi:hypothetical protein